MKSVEEIISSLNLKPHPEGGYFRETYRSDHYINEESLTSNYNGKRNHSTCIYFLLTSDTFSAFHRIQQDEIWHFYSCSPILLSPGFDFADFELPTRHELISLFPGKEKIITRLPKP